MNQTLKNNNLEAARLQTAAVIVGAKTPVTWRTTFDSSKSIWGHITAAQDAACRAGYEYLCWGGRIYLSATLTDLGTTEKEILTS